MDERGGGSIAIFRRKFVVSNYRKNSNANTSQKFSGIKNFFANEGYVTFFFRLFFPHGTKTYRKGTLRCFRKFLVSKSIMDKRGGDYRDFPSKICCFTYQKIRRGALLCFRNLLVSKKFMDRRGEYHDLPSKACCLKVPKKFLDEPFCVSEKFCNGMLSKIRKGAVITTCRGNFDVSQYPKNS